MCVVGHGLVVVVDQIVVDGCCAVLGLSTEAMHWGCSFPSKTSSLLFRYRVLSYQLMDHNLLRALCGAFVQALVLQKFIVHHMTYKVSLLLKVICAL